MHRALDETKEGLAKPPETEYTMPTVCAGRAELPANPANIDIEDIEI